ncbi:MAG TPA: gliding motility protein GldM [Paludibacteraceae bacterium]|nr:gliding motility protein GldM [Paludibacteraceae bacterium]
MSGAKNCPETPRQKMIGMMYLVLTAMLALNVSADILNGFIMVDSSLLTNIETRMQVNDALFGDLEYLYEQNPEKVGEWLEKAKLVRAKSDSIIHFIRTSKRDLMQLADGVEISVNTVNNHKLQKKDNIDIAGQYFQLNGTKARALEFKTRLEDYRNFVEEMFGNDSAQTAIYEKKFSTGPRVNAHGETVDWINSMFESMPLISVTTMLSKYENDIRTTEAELINYFKLQTDAGDFRVNKIQAFVIPTSKHVMKGGVYKAQIALSAVDSTKVPEYYIGGTRLSSNTYTVTCNSLGVFQYSGKIVLRGNDGIPREYSFKDEYTVGAPSATIANEDMNVVYMGYNNRISISVPGVASEKLQVSPSHGSLEKNGAIFIYRPKSYDDVVINVSTTLEGRSTPMGSGRFRVRTLPDPTAFLAIKDDNGNAVLYNPNTSKHKLTRKQLVEGNMVAEYADGLLKASFRIAEFTLLISDGRGGFNASTSDGEKFTDTQRRQLMGLKAGSTILIDKIKVTGAKTTTLSYAPIVLP